MALVKFIKKTQAHHVTFSVQAPGAQKVAVTGDFNNWDPEAHPMKHTGKGIWKKKLTLPPDQYEYKFLIDGEWREDPENDQACVNCFGTRNNLLILI